MVALHGDRVFWDNARLERLWRKDKKVKLTGLEPEATY